MRPSQPVVDDDSPSQHITKPKCPRDARKNEIEGTVVVEILIDAEKRVARSRVIESVPGLDEVAVDCVRSWKFKPALKRGQAVPTIARALVQSRIY